VQHVADATLTTWPPITQAIEAAKAAPTGPSTDQGDTRIGYGSPKQGQHRRACTAAATRAHEAELTARRWSGSYGNFEVPQPA